MDWNELRGHERQREWFSHAIASDRLASTFLMTGPPAVGKRTFARLIAKTLFCQNRQPAAMTVCNRCEGCAQVDASTHPDLLQIGLLPGASQIKMEQLVGDRENRMREGLCYELHMRPYYGQRRIAIIDDADTFDAEQANSLLKTLEEPPAGSLIFLISENEQRQLPTIRSRSQAVRFSPLVDADIAAIALKLGWCEDADQAAAIAAAGDGTLASAARRTDPQRVEYFQELSEAVATRPLPITTLAKLIAAQLKTADESSAKRELLTETMSAVNQQLRKELDRSFSRSIAPGTVTRAHPLVLTRAIAATAKMSVAVAANANASGLVEAWLNDLAGYLDDPRGRLAG